eukprot:Plantae.Rhodophyta-Rhodochaete_pulchella.ctg59369.p2 GENE.Plantae.Rhodophyta-Rhodochaete_pulchella.ctg59369~~Plantae.Rhodophyta-Rhodochaete_pulchella.ctg59369.p2  ORF type:complete len:114 (+),score=4.44 Plantae.Rhodophyta-Rhodochaete_pulchella.ctg59369:178-519(+)
MVSARAGPNVHAREMCSLCHPNIIWIPCYWRHFPLIYADCLADLSNAIILKKCSALVAFFNCSANKWLVQLRNDLTEIHGKSRSLVTPVATRWTSTWLSIMSVLRAREAMKTV